MDNAPHTLAVGAAKTEITPRGGPVNLAGFGFSRKSSGVLDPLWARAIYAADGVSWVVLVTVDVIGLFHDFVRAVRADLAGELGDTGRVLVCSTHNHDGPDTMGYWGTGLFNAIPVRTGADPAYLRTLREAVVRSVRAARADAEPVSMVRGRARAPRFLTENVREPGYKDDTIAWVRFDRPDGTRKAYLACFACHPEVLWDKNTLISADYVGVVCRLLEERTGAATLLFQGPLGGMVTPNIEEAAPMADRLQFMETMGRTIAGRLLQSEGSAVPVAEPRIGHAVRTFTVPLGNRVFALLHRMGVITRDGGGRTITTEANMVRIGDVLMFGAPGELLPAAGFMIKARLADAPSVFVLALCCDELGYIPAPRDFGHVAYAFERSMSAGPALSDEVLRSVCMLRALL